MLEFQHIIQVNDPNEPNVPHLSKAQLWEGLVLRSKYPAHFTPSISCSIEEVSDQGFVRVLRFGEGRLRERVELIHQQEVRTRPADAWQPMYAESITRIEEPAPGHLIVRFIYKRESGNDDGSIDVDEYLKSAYLQNDREAMRLLRKFSREGLPSADSWLQRDTQ